jgi:hypothetical protein
LEIAAKHDVFTQEEKGAPAMLSRQLSRDGKILRTFNFLSTDGDDLGHVLGMSEDEGEILRLRLKMTVRSGNRPAVEF